MKLSAEQLAKVIWEYMHMHQPLEKCDAIFVLGSSDERVPVYAAQLYFDEWARLIIFSGREGKLKASKKWGGLSEAEKFASIAMQMGVPTEDILLEKEATNTGENVLLTKELLRREGLEPKKLLLVQKPYMERRTFATFSKQWPDMDFIVSSPPLSFEEYSNEEHPKHHLISMLVGDLQRIKEYPAKGFQIEQEIPAEVWSAYEQLVALGYTEHLIK